MPAVQPAPVSAVATGPAKVEELYSAGRYAEAIELGRSILEAAPCPTEQEAKTSFLVCMSHLQLAEQDGAKPYLDAAVARFK